MKNNPVNFQKIAIAVHPTHFSSLPLHDCVKIYRLKEDLSEQWIELDFDIIDDNETSVIDRTQNISRNFLDKFNPDDIERYGHLDDSIEFLEE